VLAALFYFLKLRSNSTGGTESTLSDNERPELKVNLDLLKSRFSRDIDSILYEFGIKKEWISTYSAGEKSSKSPTRKEVSNVSWFTKNVIVPEDLTTAEVNLDISNYVNSLGLIPRVTEEIRTTAIDISVYNPLDSASLNNNTPLARISVRQADKIKRDGGIIVLILNRIGDFKQNEIENLLNTTNEFSFIFPRNTDEIDLQNKLLQSKKDVLVQLTVGGPDNPEADFRVDMDDKELKQRVKSINSDFPTIKHIILSRHEAPVPYLKLYPFLRAEFEKYNVQLFADTIATPLVDKQQEDSKDKINIMAEKMKSSALAGKMISILTASSDEFKELYEHISVLKKLGYKFYTFGRFIDREERLRKEKQAETKPEKKEAVKKKK